MSVQDSFLPSKVTRLSRYLDIKKKAGQNNFILGRQRNECLILPRVNGKGIIETSVLQVKSRIISKTWKRLRLDREERICVAFGVQRVFKHGRHMGYSERWDDVLVKQLSGPHCIICHCPDSWLRAVLGGLVPPCFPSGLFTLMPECAPAFAWNLKS